MSDLPKFVQINEEGPREGFQIEKGPIATDRKIELIDALSATGLNQIQVGLLRQPEPRARHGRRRRGGRALTSARRRPLHRAVAQRQRASNARSPPAALDIKGSISLTASETFLQRNQQRTMEDNLAAAARDDAHSTGSMACRSSAARSWPRSAAISKATSRIERVLGLVAADCSTSRPNTTSLETHLARRHHGLGNPARDQAHGRRGARRLPGAPHRLHLHDTRGMGIANAYAGLEMGVDDIRRRRRRPRRLPVRGAQGRRRQCLHRRPRVHVPGDGHRDRHRPGTPDRLRGWPRTSSVIRSRDA